MTPKETPTGETPAGTTEEPQGGVGTDPSATATAAPEGGGGSEEFGVQTGFSLSTLQGKSNPEVEAYVSLLEGTVREQNAALNTPAPAPAPAPAPVTERTDFYDDPRQAIREEVGEMIAPFVADLRESRSDRARTQMQDEFGVEWGQMEPIVDNLISQGRRAGMTINDHDPAMLRTLFYTAKGYQNHVATPAPTAAEGTQAPSAPQAPAVIPQHRPSAAPLPQGGAKPAVRELTENERRLAREWKMTPEEYIELQEAEADEFLDEETTSA